jgi:hypothetical protein
MHLYFKYQSPNILGSEDVVQIEVFQNQVKVLDQGHNIKSLHHASISQDKSPNTFGSKDIAQIDVFQYKVKVQGHKVKSPAPKERSLHHASISQVSKP